jgi:hypothetical protein
MPKVAILDSGVHAGHPHVGEVVAGFNATGMGAESDWLDRIGHGTAVAGAIRSLAPDVELMAIKIFEGGLRTNLDIILRGVEWALAHDADLINLSLGTTNEAHAAKLSEWVARGSIWVSAATAYPGMLDGVIGIELDATLERNQLRVAGPMRFAASPYPREIPGVSREKNLQGISFAVANVTGLLAASWGLLEEPGAASAARVLASLRG